MNESKNAYTRKKWKPWLKAALIKFWFYGAIYYFVGWGLFLASSDQLDVTMALGLVIGAANDLAIGRIFRSMESSRLEYHPYMMVRNISVAGFFCNIAYGVLLSFLVAYFYHFVNLAIIALRHLPETAIPLGAEPVLYGIVMMLFDITLTHLVHFVFRKKEKKPCDSTH